MVNLSKEFAERLEQSIAKKKVSRKVFFDLHEISTSKASDCLNGEIPDAMTVSQFAGFLDIDTDWLITGQGSREKRPEAGQFGNVSLTSHQEELLALDLKSGPETRQFVKYIYQRNQCRSSQRRVQSIPVDLDRRSGRDRR